MCDVMWYVWWCDGVVFSALLIVDFGLEEEADIWWWTILTVLLCECVLCCVTLREREDVDTAQHRPLSCQSSKSFTLWAGKWVEEWREKTVKITNNILTLCLTAVFMSWLEIKEVFTELCFHMSASQPGWWRGDQKYLRINSSQVRLHWVQPLLSSWFCQWLRRKEGDGGFIVDRAWFELIIVTISSVRTRNSLNRKKNRMTGIWIWFKTETETYSHSPPGSEGGNVLTEIFSSRRFIVCIDIFLG